MHAGSEGKPVCSDAHRNVAVAQTAEKVPAGFDSKASVHNVQWSNGHAASCMCGPYLGVYLPYPQRPHHSAGFKASAADGLLLISTCPPHEWVEYF